MSYDSEVLADSPYAYWKLVGLGASDGNVPDSSGGAQTANPQVAGSGYTVAQAAIFPNSVESVDVAGTSGRYFHHNITGGLTTYSVDLLMRPTGIGSGTKGAWAFGGSRHIGVTAAGALALRLDGGTEVTSANGLLANNTSYHVMATYNHTTGAIRGYINGVEVINVTGSAATVGNDYVRFPWRAGDGNELAGRYSHVAVYPSVLSAARAAAHYAAASSHLVDAPPMLAGPSQFAAAAAVFSAPLVVDAPAMLAAVRVLAADPVIPPPVVVVAPPFLLRAPRIPAAAVPVATLAPLGRFVVDPSQGWGMDLGVLIDVRTQGPDDAPGSRITQVSETYDDPTIVDGRPVS